MSTHAFIPDPVIDQAFHVSLQIPAIVIFAALGIFGVIILYALLFRTEKNPVLIDYL